MLTRKKGVGGSLKIGINNFAFDRYNNNSSLNAQILLASPIGPDISGNWQKGQSHKFGKPKLA